MESPWVIANRNARLSRLRELVPVTSAIVGIDPDGIDAGEPRPFRRRRRKQSGSGRRVGRGCHGRGRSARWFGFGVAENLGVAEGTPASRELVITACRLECGLMCRGMPAAFVIPATMR